MKPCLKSTFFAWISSFTSCFHQRLLFCLPCHTKSFPSACPSSRWSYSCFEQPPLHFRVRCAFRGFSEQGWYAVHKSLSYIFVRQGLPLYSVGSPDPARLCRPWRVFQMQVADYQVVIGWTFLLTWDPFVCTVCQLRAYEYTHSSLSKLCWLNARVEVFPFFAQLNSVWTTTLRRGDSSNIQEISFGFLDQSCSFPMSDVMFRFPITSLGRDCRSRVAVGSPSAAFCAVTLALHRCVAGATWGFHLWISDGVDFLD